MLCSFVGNSFDLVKIGSGPVSAERAALDEVEGQIVGSKDYSVANCCCYRISGFHFGVCLTAVGFEIADLPNSWTDLTPSNGLK